MAVGFVLVSGNSVRRPLSYWDVSISPCDSASFYFIYFKAML